MPATSASQDFNLPAIAMSLEQFRAFLGDIRSHFEGDEVVTQIRVQSGIETHHYSRIDELTAEDPALPDIIEAVEVDLFKGRYKYDASHSVMLKFAHGGAIRPSSASVTGPAKGWVLGVCLAIAQGCRKRATWCSILRLHGVLVAAAFMMFIGLFVLPLFLPTPPKHHHGPILGALAYVVSLILLAGFVGFDRLYYAAFPSTVIVVRTGPRRVPYEALMLILAILCFIFALITLVRG